jgi:hypothetical protein
MQEPSCLGDSVDERRFDCHMNSLRQGARRGYWLSLPCLRGCFVPPRPQHRKYSRNYPRSRPHIRPCGRILNRFTVSRLLESNAPRDESTRTFRLRTFHHH